MLTTIDNPYNPREDYIKWLKWDHDNNYYTNEYLMRVADVNVMMTEYEIETKTQEAMLSILQNDMLDIYVVV